MYLLFNFELLEVCVLYVTPLLSINSRVALQSGQMDLMFSPIYEQCLLIGCSFSRWMVGHQSCSMELIGKYDHVLNRSRHLGWLAHHSFCCTAMILLLEFAISYTHTVMTEKDLLLCQKILRRTWSRLQMSYGNITLRRPLWTLLLCCHQDNFNSLLTK